ncbi:MAG: 50S ribosomal protein L3 [Myxococcota bacterium]|nr:50S ribosomal protein L3 [Myxococcota bacterium]
MSIELLCRKLGMSQVFTDAGESVPVTVLEAGPNTVVQIKREDGPDGYTAVQLGFGTRREDLFNKPARGHFAKAGVEPQRFLLESRLTAEEADGLEVGQQVTAELFEPGQKVDAIGTSKGRGFTGVVKRHGFKIKKRTHGTHEYFRHPGSIGAGAWPAKVFKGGRQAGQMGDARVTVQNLEVIRVDTEKNLVFVRGAVPGHIKGLVKLRHAIKQ